MGADLAGSRPRLCPRGAYGKFLVHGIHRHHFLQGHLVCGTRRMDLTPAAEDIEELIREFAEMEGTKLTQMKKLWRDKSFSFIHEARPKDVTGSFFIQGLFSCALRHITDGPSLSWKLGGLYALYALHGTQSEKPPCCIYLSLEELESLCGLVKSAKENQLNTAYMLVRKMVKSNNFLYGSVSANQKRIAESKAELVRRTNARVQRARAELFENVPIENYLNRELGQELGLGDLSVAMDEYNKARKKAFSFETRGRAHDGGGLAELTIARDLKEDANNLKTDLLALAKNPSAVPDSEMRNGNAGSHYETELEDDEGLDDFERELVQELDSIP